MNNLRRTTAGLAVLAALALTACSAEDDAAEFDDAETSGPTAQGAAEPTGQGDDQADDGTQQSPDAQSSQDQQTGTSSGGSRGPVDPNDAVETVTYDIPHGEIDGTITVGLHHLRAQGNTMELLLTYTPEFDTHDSYSLWELHNQTHALVRPSLFDRENLKRYDILRSDSTGWDDDSVWASHQADIDLRPGQSQAYWANFAVPEDDIDSINIGLPSGPEFQDVEIETSSDEPTAVASESGE